MYTKQQRIAELARQMPDVSFTSLAYHIDLEWLREAYRATRKDGAAGVDGVTAGEYESDLEGNLQSLLDRFKSGSYFAPPVKRAYIPKGDGRTRPIGIPALEDKILQRAVVMVLSPLYEQDFMECSYGFRPERSAHQALEVLWAGIMEMGGVWVLEVDIKSFFDTVVHKHLREILSKRVRDGVLLRMIGKWLKAGVMEDGSIHYPEEGTPQGGVISPLLSNIYLHDVLDSWFESVVKPRLDGKAELIRFADDYVILLERERDARRILSVLPKRFGKYGLTIHDEKTQLVDFRRPYGDRKSETFDFLGFTHYWGKSRKGQRVVKRKTAKIKLKVAVRKVYRWCRGHRHDPIKEQWQALCRKLHGHYGFYGITFNLRGLKRFYEQVKRAWRKWLNRRNRDNDMQWERFNLLLVRYPLPEPRIVHKFA
ncbi:MAG: group II intron reverse transcriptase/maturase [Nitrospiraceae bacterium]